jgi:hypothetical protein
MIRIPKRLAALSHCVADHSARFSMTGIQVKELETGYQLNATDGRILARVNVTTDKPEVPAFLADAPNSAMVGILSADKLTDACKRLPKQKRNQPESALLAIPTEAAFTLASEDTTYREFVPNVEGRFPDTDMVFPKGEPIARVRLGVKLLQRLLKAAEGVGCDALTFEMRDKSAVTQQDIGCKPVIVTGTAEDNAAIAFTGLIMPVCQLR